MYTHMFASGATGYVAALQDAVELKASVLVDW